MPAPNGAGGCSVDFVGSVVVSYEDCDVAGGCIHDGIADKCRALGRARVLPAVAADVGHGVGAVAAGGIGERRQDAGLNFGDIEYRAAPDTEAEQAG